MFACVVLAVSRPERPELRETPYWVWHHHCRSERRHRMSSSSQETQNDCSTQEDKSDSYCETEMLTGHLLRPFIKTLTRHFFSQDDQLPQMWKCILTTFSTHLFSEGNSVDVTGSTDILQTLRTLCELPLFTQFGTPDDMKVIERFVRSSLTAFLDSHQGQTALDSDD